MQPSICEIPRGRTTATAQEDQQRLTGTNSGEIIPNEIECIVLYSIFSINNWLPLLINVFDISFLLFNTTVFGE